MYLKSLKVADFAGLGRVEFGPFSPELNVLVGNNEAGKSTLLTALRAAFFHKHRGRGEAIEAFAPYRGEGRPQVAVEFQLGEAEYALSKSFLQRPGAELSWGRDRLSGDAVEEKLAELLGFTHPGRGNSKLSEHQGAFGLLWVEQGRSNGSLDIGAGKDALTASLEGEVGQMLGGERGRGMIVAAKALHDRFFTATGRSLQNSPAVAAEKELKQLLADLDDKRTAWRELEEQLKRLEDRRRRLRDYEADGTVSKAESAVRLAEEDARKAADRDREWRTASAALKHAEALKQSAFDRLAGRDALAAAATKAAGLTQAARIAFAEADAELRRANGTLTEAMEAREAARDEERAIERRHEGLRLKGELDREKQALQILAQAIATAGQLAEEASQKRRSLAAIVVDAKALAAIEAAERRHRDCEVRLSVAAPMVTFFPEADRIALREDGTAVPPETGQRITTASRFSLTGFGSVAVDPGGDAAALLDESRAAEKALRLLLERHGVASTEAARQSAEAAARLRSEIATLAARQQALLPGGLEEAATRRQSAVDAVARHEASLSKMADANAELEDGDTMDILRDRLDAARRRTRMAEEAADEARALVSEAAMRRGSAESEVGHRDREAQRLGEELEQSEATMPRGRLIEDLAAAGAEWEARQAQFARSERELAALDPKKADAELVSRRQALERISRTVADLRDETLGLEGEIRGKEGRGLGEAIATLEDEATELERRIQRLRLEADASKLLYDSLNDARRQARERWFGPIKARVAPYLRLIHPETEIDLDEETLDVRALHRDGIEEKFERLSTGAREQVAVVARLALAHVLKQGGHPATVILDDALVNTDEERLERMHRVLKEAARELQVIVLTCRERDFRDLGAPIFRL